MNKQEEDKFAKFKVNVIVKTSRNRGRRIVHQIFYLPFVSADAFKISTRTGKTPPQEDAAFHLANGDSSLALVLTEELIFDRKSRPLQGNGCRTRT